LTGIENKSEKHRTRMQRKKQVVDAAIEKADKSKGLLLVLTGNGKGKSSSAFGMIARALGHQMRVAVAQFIKGRSDTGEEAFFRDHPGVQWHVLGEGFTWETQNLERDIATAKKAWALVKTFLSDSTINLLVLDELTYPLKYGWLDIDEVLADLQSRPPMQHVIITGRGAPPKLCQAADTVTELKDEKHAFKAGIMAQAGVDF